MSKDSVYKIDVFKTNPDKFLFWAVILFYVFNYVLVGKSPINTFPILVGIPIYILLIISAQLSIERRFFFSWVSLIFLSSLALIYLAIEIGIYVFLSMEFFFFLSLPMLYLAIVRLFHQGNTDLVVKGFLFFLGWQLFVVFGQISKRLTGIGFHLPAHYADDTSESYSLMLSGTFLNANDLAAVCGMMFIFFLFVRSAQPKAAVWGMILCIVLAILTASRSVFVFMFFSFVMFFCAKSFFRGVFVTFFSLGVLGIFYYFSQEFISGFDFASRIIKRIETIWVLISYGLEADNSISIRLFSYINFLDNIGNLGLGSITLRDYSVFVDPLGTRFELMATNPHSFVVEISYWLGWLGLVLLGLFLTAIKPKNLIGYAYSLAAFVLLSMVSSSIINNFIFFLSFFSVFALVSAGPERMASTSDQRLESCLS